ncbi:related to AIF1 - mitochondrial cell death effector [Melanopsichium pennsylvanicum]|uniref:Related to AIF1 - mitochondrial cell death effector n=2 Tax=Melanopsichium pennsylvanicum TaxID=63383 RepID=A0AAJ5C7E1_9BASI|nr:amid-like nadh [Melanopsichium pennsylvanicum 4]SNX86822.1 related to AIF1 - mitochondrial cell death effector [Melanopsichium pennsylvanicum]
MTIPVKATSTVAIIGGSYVGMRLAQSLLPLLPSTHRVVVVEANSHFHHLFTFPRFAVLHRGGEEKSLIPYTHALDNSRNNASIIHAKALSIHCLPTDPTRGYLKLDRPANSGDNKLEFDFLAIATGTQLRSPWSLPSTHTEPANAKAEAVNTLRSYQDAVKAANNIVIVGGGAVGVQVACDIAELYPNTKSITLLHSRNRVMNKFHADLHQLVSTRFAERGVKTILGSRVVIPDGGFPEFQEGKTFDVKLQNGDKMPADLVLLCTGQTPRSDVMRSFAPETITSDGFINVSPTLQIKPSSPGLKQHIFALGDIANSGAAKTVRSAMGQIDVISSNILTLIESKAQPNVELKQFTPGPSGIHLSLGLYESIKFGNPSKEGEAPRNLGIERDLKLDMGVEGTWSKWNVPQGTPWHL